MKEKSYYKNMNFARKESSYEEERKSLQVSGERKS